METGTLLSSQNTEPKRVLDFFELIRQLSLAVSSRIDAEQRKEILSSVVDDELLPQDAGGSLA
jgi:hypothetical protein